jgi:hypothetical protein
VPPRRRGATRDNIRDVINGRTQVIAHNGYPTSTFRSSLIYNPYFEAVGVSRRGRQSREDRGERLIATVMSLIRPTSYVLRTVLAEVDSVREKGGEGRQVNV